MKNANKSFTKSLNQILKDDFPNAYLLRFFNNHGIELTYWTPEQDVEYKQEGFVTPKMYTQLLNRNDTTAINRDNGPVMRRSGET